MDRRLELHSMLESIGVKKVYFQAPESTRMEYPCIIYFWSKTPTNKADNRTYIRHNRYDVTLVDLSPESEFVDKILELPYCSFDRHYVADGLHHYTFTIFK